MDLYGVTSADLGDFAVQSRGHARNNPRAMTRSPLTLADHQASPWIADPYHLLDCCLEADGACALLVTSAERARDLEKPAVVILGGVGGPTIFGDLVDTGFKYMSSRLFATAGVSRDDIDVALLYDNFSDGPMRMIEDIGWCGRGESKDFIREGRTSLDGQIPLQTSGGMMNEGFFHGMNNALELVQQLRGDSEDLCPNWHMGEHTYDRSICRQVRDARVGLHCGSTAKTAMLLGRL
jgi:acetyl-CoA acetyltransferase